MSDLRWQSDGPAWPNRDASRFVKAGGLRWHLQQFGEGPALLLVHGTGASTHSWRDLAPLLARRFEVLAPDLPGHGFSEAGPPEASTLTGMASALGALLQAVGRRPALAVGHSAGAAILARMTLDGALTPKGLVSLNGALLPLRGAPGHLFAPLARALVVNPLVPRLVATYAGRRSVVRRMLDGTGSTIDSTGLELYRRLAGSSKHVAAALRMMAGWDLQALQRDLPDLDVPLLLVPGGRDAMVPAADAERVRAVVPTAELVALEQLGHLAHEENPQHVAELVLRFAAELDLETSPRTSGGSS